MGFSDTQMLSKLYLELSQVVPEGTKTLRELRLETKLNAANAKIQMLAEQVPISEKGLTEADIQKMPGMVQIGLQGRMEVDPRGAWMLRGDLLQALEHKNHAPIPVMTEESIKRLSEELEAGAPALREHLKQLDETRKITPELMNTVIGPCSQTAKPLNSCGDLGHGYACSLPTGHNGWHVAEGADSDGVLASWPEPEPLSDGEIDRIVEYVTESPSPSPEPEDWEATAMKWKKAAQEWEEAATMWQGKAREFDSAAEPSGDAEDVAQEIEAFAKYNTVRVVSAAALMGMAARARAIPGGLSGKDRELIRFIVARLIGLHDEDRNADYIIGLLAIANRGMK